jgi:hypothetical protein
MSRLSIALVDRPMARKRTGRPKTSTRDDVAARTDRGVIARVRYAAETWKISLAEYLSEILRPVVQIDFERATRGEGSGEK